MGVDLCFPLRGQPLLPGVTVCPSEWTCVCPIRGQCLLMGVDLCCTLRGQPLLPGVTICPSQWKCAYPLRGPPSPAWTRRGVPGGRTPHPYPCPHPHLHEGCHVHHVARVQVPLSALLHVRHLQVLTPASRYFMMLSTCTQRSVICAGHRGRPHSGAGHALRMPN